MSSEPPPDPAAESPLDPPSGPAFVIPQTHLYPVLHLQAVLVLHRCALEDSVTWQSLAPQLAGHSSTSALRLLICVNETQNLAQPELPSGVETVVRARNAGLAWAYNAALSRAHQSGSRWLLTLDQDTHLPADYLDQLFAHAAALDQRHEISAIVPQLVNTSGQVYSPVLARLAREEATPRGFVGVSVGDLRAFNSAALWRVTSLQAIGGFDPRFWLDFLDHATFRALGQAGFRVWIAGNLELEHHLSLTDDRANMTPARFGNFLEAESAFVDLYASRLAGALYTLRLCGRMVNQRRRGDAAHFTDQTWELLRLRLTTLRSVRIAAWTRGCELRMSETQ